MLCARRIRGKDRSRGFTLFEMVVVICSIVILYMVAVQRLNQLPAAAERAAFNATISQLKTGVNLEMYTLLANHRDSEVRALVGSNPMDLLLEAPGNYRGNLPDVDDDTVERRASWYFETTSGELVYVVGGSSIENVWVSFGSIEVNFGQVRFSIQDTYREVAAGQSGEEETGSAPLTGQKWQGVQLLPVRDYRWVEPPGELIDTYENR